MLDSHTRLLEVIVKDTRVANTDLSPTLCSRQRQASARHFGPHVVRNQLQQLRKYLRGLEGEGIRYVFKRETGICPACHQVPRARIPENHLRPRVSPAGKPHPIAIESCRRETLAGAAGICARRGRLGEIRP